MTSGALTRSPRRAQIRAAGLTSEHHSVARAPRPALKPLILPAGSRSRVPVRVAPAGQGEAPRYRRRAGSGTKKRVPTQAGTIDGRGVHGRPVRARSLTPIETWILESSRNANVQMRTIFVRHDLKAKGKQRRSDLVIPARPVADRDDIGRAADQMTASRRPANGGIVSETPVPGSHAERRAHRRA